MAGGRREKLGVPGVPRSVQSTEGVAVVLGRRWMSLSGQTNWYGLGVDVEVGW